MSKTVLEVLEQTTLYFQRQGVASPRLTIELLLADLLQKPRLALYLGFADRLDDAQLDRLRPLVKRRAAGEPIEYVLGSTEFAGQKLRVSPAVLIPRPETEILLEAILPLIDPAGLPVADIGTGSGILARAMARRFPALDLIALDLSPAALALARENLAAHGNIRCLESDLLSEPSLPPRFQLLVANLPYIPSARIDTLAREVRHEPRLALDGGADGLEIIARLIAQSHGRTRFLALEFGDGQAPALESLCQKAGYALTRILPDFTGTARVLIAEAAAGPPISHG